MRPGMDKKENCGRKSQIIELVYGEADGAHLTELRSHLSSCTECSDEFSFLSSARLDIVEFKRDVFDSLKTPEFNFCEAESSDIGSKTILGWLDGLRYAFALKLSFAGILIGVLVGMFGLIYIQRQDEVQVAANTAFSSPTDPPQIVNKLSPGASEPLKGSNETVDLAEKVTEAPRRNSGVGTARTKKASPALKSVNRRIETEPSEDFADDSLRLADLLEQIGG